MDKLEDCNGWLLTERKSVLDVSTMKRGIDSCDRLVYLGRNVGENPHSRDEKR